MPISHEHKCIFFHVPKCAGSTIESKLRIPNNVGDLPDTKVLWGLHVHDLYEFVGPVITTDEETILLSVELQHLTPEQMLHTYVTNDIFDDYFKFVFIRNPWDRLVSEYCWKPRFSEFKTFLNWVKDLDMESELNQYPHFIPQYRFVYDRDGGMMVDFVGRFETLFQDWEYVRKKLKINEGLPHLAKSKHESYVQYYDQHSIDLVADIYHKDIELFGYKFGE